MLRLRLALSAGSGPPLLAVGPFFPNFQMPHADLGGFEPSNQRRVPAFIPHTIHLLPLLSSSAPGDVFAP